MHSEDGKDGAIKPRRHCPKQWKRKNRFGDDTWRGKWEWEDFWKGQLPMWKHHIGVCTASLSSAAREVSVGTTHVQMHSDESHWDQLYRIRCKAMRRSGTLKTKEKECPKVRARKLVINNPEESVYQRMKC